MSGWRRWRVPALFAAVILLPVVLAALTLHQGWYEPGTRGMSPARVARGTGCTRRSTCCNRFLPISTNGDWSIWWPLAARGNAGRSPR